MRIRNAEARVAVSETESGEVFEECSTLNSIGTQQILKCRLVNDHENILVFGNTQSGFKT